MEGAYARPCAAAIGDVLELVHDFSLQVSLQFDGLSFALPDNTRIYCAHEYTLANLRFAHAVEPDNADIRVRLEVVEELRAADRMTLPTDLALEKRTNPFLRAECDAVTQAASKQANRALKPGVETFATVRSWKDSF